MDNRQQKRVTLRHLASVCNLSVSTVSQILNNRDTYSTEKNKRTGQENGARTWLPSEHRLQADARALHENSGNRAQLLRYDVE